MYIHLDSVATKTITITVEAYERLSSVKEERESFSDVINRITGKYSLLSLAGILSDKESEDMKMHIRDLRKRMNEDFGKRRVPL